MKQTHNAPDIVSKIREALDAEMEHQGAMMVRTLDSEAMAKALLPQFSAMLAKEPVSGEKCRRAVGQLFFRFRDDLAARGHKAIYESYPSSNEIVKAVLDAAGVPYTEAMLAGGEKGE